MTYYLSEDHDHEIWKKTAELALSNAEEASKNGKHGVAQRLRDAADVFLKKAEEAKGKLKRTVSLMEGEPGYDRMSDEEKYQFHSRMADRAIPHHIDPDTLHPDEKKSIMDEWIHHVAKASEFLQKIAMRR